MTSLHATATRLAVLALLSCLAGCGESTQVDDEQVWLNLDPDVDRVGLEACRECHFEKHATYVHTGMGRAFYPMSPDVAVEDFATDNEFVVEPLGLRYRMEERDGKYFQKQFLLASAGRELVEQEHELVWVIGSNNHCRSYAIEIDGKLFQAPVCWYPQEQKWELCPGFEFKNEHFAREISMSCIHCHNGQMELVAGERNEYERPYPHGIDCERCHGPGQLHVERWSAGDDTPAGGLDPTIVNPRRLPPAQRIEVCYQCHLGDAKATERVARHDRELQSWRPGELLTEVVVPFHYVEPTQWDFGLSAQADRLLLSRCFKQSGGKIECLTCHNPHVTVYHEDRPVDFFKRKCLGCHDLEACSGDPAARQATEPTDDCVACHMRRAEPDDQRFTAFTDHWIRKRIDLDGPDERRNYDVEPIFADRFARLPDGEQAYFRARARALLARDAPPNRRSEMWVAAERDFRSAIDLGQDTVEAWYFLAKTLRNLGRQAESEEAFRTAHDRDPTHHDAAYAVGQDLLALGKAGEALAIFEAMLERDGDDALALAEAGRAHMALGQADRALERYERALEQEPWSASLHLNMGKVLASLGRFELAAERGSTAARLDPEEPAVWEFYENVMKAAGRTRAAADGRAMRERLRRAASAAAEPSELGQHVANAQALGEDRLDALP